MGITVNLAVDSGKYSTKVSKLDPNGNIQHFNMRTKMDQGIEKMSLSNQDKTYQVDYEGVRYLLGEQATTISNDTQKAELIHKVATYTAIALQVGHGDHVNLAIGCPLSTYINRDARIRYKDFIAKNGSQINIKIDGKAKMFIIDRVFVYPEASGVMYLNLSKYQNSTVGVIDIGGLNANCCIYKNLIPQPDSMFTLKAGGNILTKDIMGALESACLEGDQIPEVMYDQIMRDGQLISYEDSAHVVEEQKKLHVNKIRKECEGHKWGVKLMPIVFTGGTSSFMVDEIKAVFPTADLSNLDDNVAYKNADGFLYQMLDVMGVAH